MSTSGSVKNQSSESLLGSNERPEHWPLRIVLAAMCILLVMRGNVGGDASSNAPLAFASKIGFALDSSYEVKLEGDALIYVVTDVDGHSTTARIVPTDEQWRQFRNTLDRIGAWSWKRSYEPPTEIVVLDGSAWSLKIKYGDKQLQTGGDNSFPDRDGKPSPDSTPVFSEYLNAVKDLLRGRSFGK